MRSYYAVHAALKRRFGAAGSWQCALYSCTERAAEWAYSGRGDLVARDPGGHGLYADDVDAYQPMCRRHHREFDREMRHGSIAYEPA